MPRKYVVLASILLLLVICTLVVKALYGELIVGYMDYIDDHKDRHWPGEKEGVIRTNLERAADVLSSDVDQVVRYIYYCKRFPANLEDAYKSFENAPTDCSPFPAYREKNRWLDPWGRPYQIRYHKERRKVQMRSRGRYLDNRDDDIVRETPWGIAGSMLYKEIDRCNELSENDMGCVFNRGWH